MNIDVLHFTQRILILPQHEIILLGKQLQLLRRQLRLDSSGLGLAQRCSAQVRVRGCRARTRHRNRHRGRDRPSPARLTLIQHALLLLADALNALLDHIALGLGRALEPPPQEPEDALADGAEGAGALLIGDLLGGFVLGGGVCEGTGAGSPAEEGGRGAVFLAEEAGFGFLAERFGGGEVGD